MGLSGLLAALAASGASGDRPSVGRREQVGAAASANGFPVGPT